MAIFCKVCGEIFKSNISLIRHRRCKNRKCGLNRTQNCCLSGSLICYLNKNSTFKVLECTRCGKTFSHLIHLLIHMRIHTKNTPYKCDFCSKTFMLRLHLYYHLDSHQKEDIDVNKCVTCNSEVQELLRKFSLTGSTVSSLICLFCKKKRFSNVSQFIVHLRTHCHQTSVCSDCGRVSISFQNIVSHLKSQAALTQTRDRHYRPVGTKSAKEIQCESCGRTFQKLQLLEIHLLSHISDPLFCCRNCQEVFRNGRLYLAHMKRCERRETVPSPDVFVTDHSTEINDEAFDCPYCKLTFSSPSQLHTHLPLHSATKESKSDTESADEDFMTKDQNEAGMNSSPDYISIFVCPNCGQVFKEKEGLGLHMKTDCPLDYNCKHCFKIFNRCSDLEQHKRNHDCINHQSNYLDQGCYKRPQPADYEVRHLSSKPLYRCSQCYKSFVSKASLDSHAKCHLAGALTSSGRDPNRIPSNCSPSYLDPGNRHGNREKERGKGDNYKGLSDRRSLCDVCGEVFWGLANLDNHMKMHNCQESREPIYTMANMNNSRQPDICPSQTPLMMFPPPGNMSTPCFVSNSRADNIFPSGQDMNSNFAKVGNMTPVSHSSSFPSVQTNSFSVPTFASPGNAIPRVNELKNVPYPGMVHHGFPFHVQNNRGGFFPIPNFDNRSSEYSLPYGDCRDNKFSPFPYNDNSRFNFFFPLPAQQGEIPLANTRDKNINNGRNSSVSPFINEDMDKFHSPLTLAIQNNGNPGNPQKIKPDTPRSTSDQQTKTVFIPEKESCVSTLSSKGNLGTSLDNNRPSFQASFSESKSTNFTSKTQNNLVESVPPVPMKTNTNNAENQNLEYPVNELLITLPNLSRGPNPSGGILPEIEPLNLCQTHNLEAGKFYNYPVDLDNKAFFPQQTSLIDNLQGNVQASYPVPHFWEESKSYEMNFNVGNQCPTSKNEGTFKFSPGFQIESIQPPLCSEPKTYYNMNQGPFTNQNYNYVDGKVGEMNNKLSFPAFLEDRSNNINSLYESQNSVAENESMKTGSRNLEYMPFVRLKPNYTFSNSVDNTGNSGNRSTDGVGGGVKDPTYQDPALVTEKDHGVALMQSPNVFAFNQTGAGST